MSEKKPLHQELWDMVSVLGDMNNVLEDRTAELSSIDSEFEKVIELLTKIINGEIKGKDIVVPEKNYIIKMSMKGVLQ